MISRLDAGFISRQTSFMNPSRWLRPTIVSGLLTWIALPGSAVEVSVGSVKVSAGDVTRSNAAVSFALPPSARGPMILARKASGQTSFVQVDNDGNGWLLVPELKAGTVAEYQIIKSDRVTELPVAISVERLGRKLRITQAGRPILEYQAEAGELPRNDIKESFRRGGYLHPLTTPAGTVITDDFPLNHVHHHGIWMPWTKTKFEGREPDFWNMGDGKGRVEFVKLDHYWSGSVHGGFVTEHKFVDLLAPGGKTALHEKWTLRVYPTADGPDKVWLFDLESVQSCATDQPLILPEYLYGGLGFRGPWGWNGADKTFWLTSNGETDRVKGHGTRANWCYVGGDTIGKRGGVAILGHPENFRAPQPMRIHPTEPFFCFAPQQLGEMRIEPGKPYVSKYRFVVTDGVPVQERIDAFWRDYAEPMKVEVSWSK